MKLVSLSLLGLTTAMAGLRPANGLDWTPTVGQTWNYHLNAGDMAPEDVDPMVDVYMIDMDPDGIETTIATLHAAGKFVVCYINVGTYEPWRLDRGDFPEEALGTELSNWAPERWIDITYSAPGAAEPVVYGIMKARIERAYGLGCDGIEPDNMSIAYEEDNGITPRITKPQNIDYVKWFADEVHNFLDPETGVATNMKVGMKNLVWDDESTDDLAELAKSFDFAINEECATYRECDLVKSWFMPSEGVGGGPPPTPKPVFHVEYRGDGDGAGTKKRHIKRACGNSPAEFSTILKTYPLKGPFCTCDSNDNYRATWRCTRRLDRSYA